MYKQGLLRIVGTFAIVASLLATMPVYAGGGRETTPRSSADRTPAVRDDGLFRIVATTTQASDLATILTAGVDGIELTRMMGAGVDPHLYRPTEADIGALNRADLIIYNGLNLEGQLDEVLESLTARGVAVHPLTAPVSEAGFVLDAGGGAGSGAGTADPHIWFDPRNWALVTEALAERLATLDTVGADSYRANASSYLDELALLFDWADAGMRAVSPRLRRLVTSHDAFRYFGDAFGWEVAAIQGISTEAEAGVADIESTVDLVIDSAVPALFVESSVSPATIEAVREAVAAAGGQVRLGVRELYSDAMAAPDAFGGTYVGMLASNVYTILQSYQCAGVELTIPPWPEALSPQPPSSLLEVVCETDGSQ